MITLLRWGFKFLLLLVFLLVGAWLGKDSAAKYLIETRGAKIVGAHVSVRKVALSPLSGEATLEGLEVGNPPGFSAAPALHLDRLRVSLDLASALSPVARLREVVVEGARVAVEAGRGGVNLMKLADAARGERKPPAPTDRRFVLDRFEFTGGRVAAQAALPGLPVAGEAPLPPVRLTGVGEKSGGETLRELVAQLIESVAREAATRGRVDGLKDRLKGVIDERVRDGGKKVEDRLKKLFR